MSEVYVDARNDEKVDTPLVVVYEGDIRLRHDAAKSGATGGWSCTEIEIDLAKLPAGTKKVVVTVSGTC